MYFGYWLLVIGDWLLSSGYFNLYLGYAKDTNNNPESYY